MPRKVRRGGSRGVLLAGAQVHLSLAPSMTSRPFSRSRHIPFNIVEYVSIGSRQTQRVVLRRSIAAANLAQQQSCTQFFGLSAQSVYVFQDRKSTRLNSSHV